MDCIRIGVIGLRRGRSLMQVFQAVGGAQITALYDLDAEKGLPAAAALGARYHADLDSFLADDVDAVVVASPIPAHAQQCIAALQAGKHVLSEVTACRSVDEARALVEAARQSSAIYMLAENCCYYDEIELVKRLVAQGRLGDVYYGEGDYVHDCRSGFYTPTGELTWRGRGELAVYLTHGLGPLLYITQDRVAEVTALTVPGGKFDERVTQPTMYLLQMKTAAGRVFRTRVDYISPRPHQSTTFFALQGTQGSYESLRGFGDQAKVWLSDEHTAPPGTRPSWHELSAHAPQVIPDRLSGHQAADTGGHGNSEYWMLRDFLAAVRGERPSPIDVYTGLDYTLPGIYALMSAARSGEPVAVPDPRLW